MTENNAKIDQSSTSEERVTSEKPALPRVDSKRVIELAKEFEIKAKTVTEESPVSPKQKKKTVGLGTKIKHVFQFWKKQDEVNRRTLHESRSFENLNSNGDPSPRDLSPEGTPPPSPSAAAKLSRTRSSTVGQSDQPSGSKADLPADLRTPASPKTKRKRGVSEGKSKTKKDVNKHAADSKTEDTDTTGEQQSQSSHSKSRKHRVVSMRVHPTNNNTTEATALEHQRATSASSRMELQLDQLKLSQTDPSLLSPTHSISPKSTANTDRSSRSRSYDTTPPTSPKSDGQSPPAESVLSSESSDDEDDDNNVEKEEAGSVVKWIKKKRKKLKKKMKSQKSLERLGQAALRIVSPRREKPPSAPSSPRKVVTATVDTIDTAVHSPTDVVTVAVANAAASAELLPVPKEPEQTTNNTVVAGTQNNNTAVETQANNTNKETQPTEVKAVTEVPLKSESEDILDDSESGSEPPPTTLEIVASISKPEIPPVALPTAASLETITETSDGAISNRSSSAPSNPTTPRAMSGKFRPPLITKVSQKFTFSSKLDNWLSARTGQNEFLSKKILKKKIFADSLDNLCSGGRKTPLFVDECVDQIMKASTQEDFQLSFSYRHPIPLDVVEFNKQSIEAGAKQVKDIRDTKIVTSLLLTFLTDLAGDPVLSDKFYYFIEAQAIEDAEQRRITLHSLIYSLPILHRQLLKKILIFLDHLVSKSFNLKHDKDDKKDQSSGEQAEDPQAESSTSNEVELTKEELEAKTVAWSKRETEELLLCFGAALAKRHSLLSSRFEVIKPINSLSPQPSLTDLPGTTPRPETGRTEEKPVEEAPKDSTRETPEKEKKDKDEDKKDKKEESEERKETVDSPKVTTKKNKGQKNKEKEKQKEKEKNKQSPKPKKEIVESKSTDNIVDQSKASSRSKIRKRSSFKDNISQSHTPSSTPPNALTLANIEDSNEASPRRTLEKRMSWTGPASVPKTEESESELSESGQLNKTPEKAAAIPEANEETEVEPRRPEQSQSDTALMNVNNMLRSSAGVFVRSLNTSDESIGTKSPATRSKNNTLKSKKASPSKSDTNAAEAEKDNAVEPIPREKCILNFSQDDKEMDQKVTNLMKVLIAERKYIFSKSFPDIAYQMKEGHLIIQSSKIDNLVAKLLDTNYNDRDFIDLFLIAYYYFIEPQDLLDKLVAVFHKMSGTDLKKWQLNNRVRILQLLKMWVKTQREEFQKKPVFVDKFKQFIRSTTRDTFKTKEEETIVSQFLNDMFLPATLNQIKSNFLQKEQQKKIEASKSKSKIDILTIDARKIANALSAIDHRLFKAITPRECLNKSFVDPVNGVNFVKMTVRFNTLGRWVQSIVLSSANSKQRAQAISHFLDIAAACIEENNFNTALAIFTAMNAVSISRLKSTWVKVHKKSIKILEQIDELFSMRFNYKNYRDALAQAHLPVVPYIGLFTKFLFAIEETNMSILPGDMINFEKLRMLYAIVKEIKKYQGHDYLHQVEPELEMFLEKLDNTMAEEELYQISLKIEPQKK